MSSTACLCMRFETFILYVQLRDIITTVCLRNKDNFYFFSYTIFIIKKLFPAKLFLGHAFFSRSFCCWNASAASTISSNCGHFEAGAKEFL